MLSGCIAVPDSGAQIPAGKTSTPTRTAPPAEFATYAADPHATQFLNVTLTELTFADGCVRVGDGEILVLPEGYAAWNGDTLVFNGHSYQDGDQIPLGGLGSRPRDQTDGLVMPDACTGAETFIANRP
jgi:hypothetical protein